MTANPYEAMLARLPRRAPAKPRDIHPEPRVRPAGRETVKTSFTAALEASLKGVQSGFQHLSADDIAHPPHQWFDAALARQIAIHLMVTQFHVPKRHIAEETQRSREAINRALETVSNRLVSEEFAASYDAMAARAMAILKGDGGAGK